MLSNRLSPTLASVAVALSLAIVGGLAPAAEARATKAPAPELAIESKFCTIGPMEADRVATITASALLGQTGDHVAMRFVVQQRIGTGKSKWRPVVATSKTNGGGIGSWEEGQSGRAGLRYTKAITALAEGVQYRIAVDARGLDSAGKVVTKMARKYVLCNQPLFTPTLSLTKVTVTDGAPEAGAAGPMLSLQVRNSGRLPADELLITLRELTPNGLVLLIGRPLLAGNSTTTLTTGFPPCSGRLSITVQVAGTADEDLTPAQSKVIECAATPAGQRSAAAARR